MIALNNAITHRECSWSLSKHPPKTFQEVLDRAHEFARAKEDFRAKRGIYEGLGGNFKQDKKRRDLNEEVSEGDPHDKVDQKRPKKDLVQRDVKPRDFPKLLDLTPLNASLSQILMKIKDKPYFLCPQMKEKNENRNPSKYCEYHCANGHTTDDCWALKEEVEKLIKAGHLGRYVKEEKKKSIHDLIVLEVNDSITKAKVIHMIVGGPSVGGMSNNSR